MVAVLQRLTRFLRSMGIHPLHDERDSTLPLPRTAIQFNKKSDIVGTHTCKDYYRVPLVKHKPHLPCEHPRAIQGKIGSTNCAPLKQNMVVSLAAHSFYPENVMAAYIHSHSRKTQLMSVPSQRRHAPGSRDVWWRYRVGEI